MPAVERAVAVSQAQVEAARAKYSAAHDALVVSGACCAAVCRAERGCRCHPAGFLPKLTLTELDSLSPFLLIPPRPPSHPTPPTTTTTQADPRYQQLYSMAVARGSSLLAGLQASAAYQAAAARLGPLVAPYAEGCAKVASPYLQAAAAHLAPSVAAA